MFVRQLAADGTLKRGLDDGVVRPAVGTSRSGRCAGVDATVFRSVVFNYFCVHTMLLYVSYDIPYIYGPARAASYGMSQSAASFLVSIIGISSTIGQVRAAGLAIYQQSINDII